MTIRLLIAEDHQMVREGLRATFEDTDIEVVGEAATGEDATQMALNVAADVLLLDVRLPGRDGFEVLREVQRQRPDLAVLFYSQHDRADFRERARALGARGYLCKHIRGTALIDSIRRTRQGVELPT